MSDDHPKVVTKEVSSAFTGEVPKYLHFDDVRTLDDLHGPTTLYITDEEEHRVDEVKEFIRRCKQKYILVNAVVMDSDKV